MLASGNPAGARRVLNDSAAPGPDRDLLLGRCALQLNDRAGAAAAYSAVLARQPGNAEAVSSLGMLYLQQGLVDKAEALYSKALKKADSDRLRVEYGVVLFQRRQFKQALAEFDRVIARTPGYHPALDQRARAYLSQGRPADAVVDLRRIVEEDPGRDDCWALLGHALFSADQKDDAVVVLREAVRRRPDDMAALKSLALSLALTGHLAEGREVLARLRQADPERWREILDSTRKSRIASAPEEIDPRPLFLLFSYQAQKDCDWRHRREYEETFRDYIANPGYCNPYGLAHCSGIVPLTPAERRRMMENVAAATGAGIEPWQHVPAPAPERLRIGYVMSRVGDHVVSLIMHRLIAAHDPQATEVHVFAVSQHADDFRYGLMERYAALPGVTAHDCSGLDDEAVARLLRDKGFDVLVDLAVYNDHGRPGIFARRPAPVQVSYLGAPYTSGAPWMDYIITDPQVSPEAPGWCTEAEARMPACYFVYGHDDAVPPEVPPRSAFGLPEEAFLYSALNNPYKIDPADFECWMRILEATPGSLLLLKAGARVAANLNREAAARGVDPARLRFLPWVSERDYLLRQGAPDLFLDARYYGAHTTMAESLWMGVPALSCRGDAFQSRVGASLLAACGLPELIMPDREAYEETAIALFRDRARLASLKDRLRETRLVAAPFDIQGQARRLEAAFRHMRARFAQGLPPATFDIPD